MMLTFFICIFLGIFLGYILFNYFNIYSLNSILGYALAIFSLLVIIIAMIRTRNWKATSSQADARQKFANGGTLVFRLLVFPFLILITYAVIAYLINGGDSIPELMLAYFSIFLGSLGFSLGLMSIFLYLLHPEKYKRLTKT